MKQTLSLIPVILLLCTILFGCRQEKKSSGERWKPWTESNDHSILESDSTSSDSLGTDTVMSDSASMSDSLRHDDNLEPKSVHASHQILRGSANNKDVYLNFSTINGTHLIGNAIIDGQATEITGSVVMIDTIQHIVIEEPRAMRDSTRFRIEAKSTSTGYVGTYQEGSLSVPIRLER